MSEEDLKLIRDGDMAPLKVVFESNYTYCVKNLQKLFGCSESDAKDIAVDAILVLREKIMTQEFVNQNVRGFIVKVASNKWRNQRRRNDKLIDYDPIALGKLLSIHANTDEAENTKLRVNKVIQTIKTLGDPCRSVLQLNLVSGFSLDIVYRKLGYRSKGVLKTTKTRCMKKLLKAINSQ